ncbi:MAG: hypothetical protein DRN96_01120 [Thermoproteota archaeon]|nr:MAG: hypothetical protein DRN96_01120 [Candidatus Korarchaeota archaeon]
MGFTHYIARASLGDVDWEVHRRFVKYGRGSFPGPALKVTVRRGTAILKSSFELEDLVGWATLKAMPEPKVSVSGVIYGYKDFSSILAEIGCREGARKAERGMFKAKVELEEIDAGKLAELYEAASPTCIMLLNVKPISSTTPKLTVKKRIPKPLVDVLKTDFAVGRTRADDIYKLLSEGLFPDLDLKAFRELSCRYTLRVMRIILPEHGDIRLDSRRELEILRELEIDGVKRVDSFRCTV